MKIYPKKVIAELNVDQRKILDYIITGRCNPLEVGSTEEGWGITILGTTTSGELIDNKRVY